VIGSVARAAPAGSGTEQLRLGPRPQFRRNLADESRLQSEF
jgi:hypothetical protein